MVSMGEFMLEDRKGKHLNETERGQIAVLDAQGYSPYMIGKMLGRASNTIRNELRRGTTTIIKGCFEKEIYLADRGQAAYEWNMRKCGCSSKRSKCSEYLSYVEEEVLLHKRSLDSIHGRAIRENLFPKEETVCTTTLYTYVERGYLKVKNIDLVDKVGRKRKKRGRPKTHKRLKGRSIEERPESVEKKEEFGHWEIDTVIGKRDGGGNALLTLTERKTKEEIIRKMEGKTAEGVSEALSSIHDMYGIYFDKIFKTITSDNGVEFSRLYELEEGKGTKVYYAHPYSSYERPLNESTNRIIRRFVPKGREMEKYTGEDINRIERWINTLPRRSLGYMTSEEAFQEELRMIGLEGEAALRNQR